MPPSKRKRNDAGGIGSRLRNGRLESPTVEGGPTKRVKRTDTEKQQRVEQSVQKKQSDSPGPTLDQNSADNDDESRLADPISHSPYGTYDQVEDISQLRQEPFPAQYPPEGGESNSHAAADVTQGFQDLVDFQHLDPSSNLFINAAATAPDFGTLGPSARVRMRTLPVLENLASQILSTFARCNFEELVSLMKFPHTAHAQAFATLKALFNLTLKIYNKERPFLDASEFRFLGANSENVIRKANLATWFLAVLGSQDASFFHLNEYFLDTFVPYGHRLHDWQGAIFLDLKTQAYLNAMIVNPNLSMEDILADLFPPDLESRLKSRRAEPTQLTTDEQHFVSCAWMRRDALRAKSVTAGGISALTKEYDWVKFLENVTTVANKQFQGIITEPLENMPLGQDSSANREILQHIRIEAGSSAQRQRSGSPYISGGAPATPSQPDWDRDAEIQSSPGRARIHENLEALEPSSAYAPSSEDIALPSGPQSEPTRVLYQRARLAATVKATPSNRRSGGQSHRRPWTAEEEAALMAGLDRVRGPHWSQILAMFGAGGTVSEVLKDRNQVQLKDKARNLKLFFLKSGNAVPPYLQAVTGELKTRAPAQVRKDQATESLRDSVDVDKATVDAINLLASGSRQTLDSQTAESSPGADGEEEQEMHEQSSDEIQAALARAMEAMNQPQQPYHGQDLRQQLLSAGTGMGHGELDSHVAEREAQFLTQRAAIQAVEDAARQHVGAPYSYQHQQAAQPPAPMLR